MDAVILLLCFLAILITGQIMRRTKAVERKPVTPETPPLPQSSLELYAINHLSIKLPETRDQKACTVAGDFAFTNIDLSRVPDPSLMAFRLRLDFQTSTPIAVTGIES